MTIVLSVAFLSACSDEEANTVEENSVGNSDITQELLVEYEEYLERGHELTLFKDYNDKVASGEIAHKNDTELADIYNRAIVNSVDDDLEEYLRDQSSFTQEYMYDETKDYIENAKYEYEQEAISNLDQYIENMDENFKPTTKLGYISTSGYLSNSQEVLALDAYVNLLMNQDSPAAYQKLYTNVKPPYKGIRSREITKFLNDKGIRLFVWEDAYKKANASEFKARIGMTTDQVLESTLGKPNKINRTVTQSTVSEQWVYDNGIYLYFDNGILTSFQD
ncbi:hypothetical protein [Planomicrobium sp. YIM 101495]|uniref:hypothetical protein n=1 Tax=Planomicrobium sp. YIM 101495 TaxID=2665160 RepID=UPI001E60976A|nr:hypothetical protein [Planomicrobium sp. YIM 101495]